MHPHRRKRLFNIILVLLFSTSGIGLILYSLNKNLDYFFTPTELKTINIPEDKRIKIGGMVLENSVVREQSKVIFTVTDYKNYIEVVYEGIVPDLFKEGSGVVALGFIQNETFYAQEVLAKIAVEEAKVNASKVALEQEPPLQQAQPTEVQQNVQQPMLGRGQNASKGAFRRV